MSISLRKSPKTKIMKFNNLLEIDMSLLLVSADSRIYVGIRRSDWNYHRKQKSLGSGLKKVENPNASELRENYEQIRDKPNLLLTALLRFLVPSLSVTLANRRDVECTNVERWSLVSGPI